MAASTPNNYIWFHDNECDDMIFYHIMKNLQNFSPILTVIGESKNIDMKLKFFRKYTSVVNIQRGIASSKDFPNLKIAGCVDDIKDFQFNDETVNLFRNIQTIYCTKPPRELLDYYSKNPIDAENLFKNITLYIYGSFNFRCIYDDYPSEMLLKMLSCFGEVYLYESFYATKDSNNINPQNTPIQTIEKIRSIPGMSMLMDEWDRMLIDDCFETCENICPGFLDKQKTPENLSEKDLQIYNRNEKAYRQIKKNFGKQFVLADPGIALTTPNDYKKTKITVSPTGLTFVAKDKDENFAEVNLIQPLNFDDIVDKLTRSFE